MAGMKMWKHHLLLQKEATAQASEKEQSQQKHRLIGDLGHRIPHGNEATISRCMAFSTERQAAHFGS
jgi:hypothetical protein